MKNKFYIFLLTIVSLSSAAELCTNTPAPAEGYCKNMRILRAVGINDRNYFYRAHPLYKYAVAASNQLKPATISQSDWDALKNELWNRVEGICGLVYDYDPNNHSTHPMTKIAWKNCIQNCQAERNNPPTAINFAGNDQVVDVCWSGSPARLAFEAEWNYLQSRLQCFQNVTANCSDPQSQQCQAAINRCNLDENVCDICFAGNLGAKDFIKNELATTGHLPLTSQSSDEGICYSYCSSILQPINLRELFKINISKYQQIPYLQISNDGISFCNLIGI